MKNNFDNPLIYESLGCTLHIFGIGFDVNGYLSESNFKQDDILFSGILDLPDEIRAKISKEQPQEAKTLEMFDSAMLLMSVSKKTDIISQMEDAICFLKKYRNELKKLEFYPEIAMIAMKFTSEQNENLSNFSDFSTEFHDLISELGIENIMLG